MKTKKKKKSLKCRKRDRPGKRQQESKNCKARANKKSKGKRAADWTHGYERGRREGRRERIEDYALGKALWLHVTGRSAEQRQRQLASIERCDVEQAETLELIQIRWCLVLADQGRHNPLNVLPDFPPSTF